MIGILLLFLLATSTATICTAQTPTSYTWVAAADAASYAIGSDGTLWSWGINTYGALGDGTTTTRTAPVALTTPVAATPTSRWTRVWASSSFAVGLRSDGTLWSWGENGFLGNGSMPSPGAITPSPGMLPMPTGAAAGTTWTDAAVGGAHTLALRSDGSLWAWGSNELGQLGIGSATMLFSAVPLPIATPSIAAPGTTWTSVVAAYGMSFALRSDGTLWSWGANSRFSPLGHPAPIGGCLQPEQVVTPATAAVGTRWTSVASGGSHTLGLRSDGTLWAWGSNSFNALGIGSASSGSSVPVPVNPPATAPAGMTWQKIQAGPSFSQAIAANGSLWAWGMNQDGQLGVNSGAVSEPRALQDYTQATWNMVAAGYQHAIGLSRGQVYVTGNGSSGQLGLGNAPNRLYFFVRVVALPLSASSGKTAPITAYPNPVSGHGILTISSLPKKATIQLVNSLGQILLTNELQEDKVQLPELPAGIYWVQIMQQGSVLGRQRLSIE